MQNGHLLPEGYFRPEVHYQSEEQKLCTIEQKSPFLRRLELKAEEDDTVCWVYVSCEAPLEMQENIPLRAYYACKAEAVFDIVERYHANPSVISAPAGIDGEVLQQDCRLLIP